jgi:hypothetical protein
MHEAVPPLPHTSSWRGAELNIWTPLSLLIAKGYKTIYQNVVFSIRGFDKDSPLGSFIYLWFVYYADIGDSV